MTIRLYIDDDALEKALVGALRTQKVDVVTAQDVNLGGSDDEEHLIYAAGQGRVLYSFNKRDFCRINKEWMDQRKAHANDTRAATEIRCRRTSPPHNANSQNKIG